MYLHRTGGFRLTYVIHQRYCKQKIQVSRQLTVRSMEGMLD
jgi:hypothetical protein